MGINLGESDPYEEATREGIAKDAKMKREIAEQEAKAYRRDAPKIVREYLFQEGVRGRIFRRAFVGKLMKLYEIKEIFPSDNPGEVRAKIKYHYNEKNPNLNGRSEDIDLTSILYDNCATSDELKKLEPVGVNKDR